MPRFTVPYRYTPRVYQQPLLTAMDSGYTRAVSVWHRRAGKDKTLFGGLMVKKAFERVGTYFYLFPSFKQGRRIIWDGMDKDGFPFLGHIPPGTIARKNSTEMQVKLINGSIIQIIGTDNIDSIVGANPIGCIFSEYSLQDPRGWDFIRPILLENSGWAVFNFTPRGKNHGWELWDTVRDNPEWFCERLTIDDTGVLGPEDIEKERREGMDEDLIQQEYYCFKPDAMVFTSRGQVPISQVKEGDFVLSHTGRFRKVTGTMSREYEGDLVEIITSGNKRAVSCTPEHRVRTFSPADQTYSWTPAVQVSRGDFMVMPLVKKDIARIRPGKHGVGVRVKEVRTTPYSGLVYNISVQHDESYVVEGRVVHNCSFEGSVQGAYFATQLRAAKESVPARITKVPTEAAVAVDTYWDLGMDDATAIWFGQNCGREVHLIDYYEDVGEGMPYYASILQEKAHENNWYYGNHVLPHDAMVRELGTGKSRFMTAKELLGLDRVRVAKKPASKADAIEATRAVFNRLWFDKDKCRRGLDALHSYRKEWDEKNKVFKNYPAHDWASHAADALQTLAMGHDVLLRRSYPSVARSQTNAAGWT